MDRAAETAWGDQYFRTAPRFETGDERYAWLNQTVFVARGRVTDRWPRVRGVPRRMTAPEVVLRPALRGTLHRWSVPVAVVLTVLLACGRRRAATRAAVIVYGCVTAMLASSGIYHAPRLARAAAAAAAPARPLDDPRRHRRHVHGGDRARPRRHHTRGPAGAWPGPSPASAWRSGCCGSTRRPGCRRRLPRRRLADPARPPGLRRGAQRRASWRCSPSAAGCTRSGRSCTP